MNNNNDKLVKGLIAMGTAVGAGVLGFFGGKELSKKKEKERREKLKQEEKARDEKLWNS